MPSLGGVETPNADPSKDSPRDSHTLQYIMASCYPITLKFIDVCYRLKLEKRSTGNNITKMLTGGGGPTRSTDTITERTILNGITGKVSPGEILAVLGPSGSGKSTLLNALAGRLQGQGFSGSVLANNRKLTKPVLKRTGFVTQDDVLYPHLTVRETLVFCSLLRLPNTLSKNEKITMAESVISELGLTKCANTIIGNSFIRGVSGGERKRVSIAHEMLINPSLLILDEPTSGLDSTAAYRLVERMGEMAEKGRRTVVMSVHQPSSRVYRMFESVLVLSEGRCIYFGKGSEAMTYFHSLGFSPSFPMNPADFLLDLANDVRQPPKNFRQSYFLRPDLKKLLDLPLQKRKAPLLLNFIPTYTSTLADVPRKRKKSASPSTASTEQAASTSEPADQPSTSAPHLLPVQERKRRRRLVKTAEMGLPKKVVLNLLAEIPDDMDAEPAQTVPPPKPKRIKKAQPKAKATEADAEAEDAVPISQLAESRKTTTVPAKRSAGAQPSGSTPAKKQKSTSGTTSGSKVPKIPWEPKVTLEDRPVYANESASDVKIGVALSTAVLLEGDMERNEKMNGYENYALMLQCSVQAIQHAHTFSMQAFVTVEELASLKKEFSALQKTQKRDQLKMKQLEDQAEASTKAQQIALQKAEAAENIKKVAEAERKEAEVKRADAEKELRDALATKKAEIDAAYNQGMADVAEDYKHQVKQACNKGFVLGRNALAKQLDLPADSPWRKTKAMRLPFVLSPPPTQDEKTDSEAEAEDEVEDEDEDEDETEALVRKSKEAIETKSPPQGDQVMDLTQEEDEEVEKVPKETGPVHLSSDLLLADSSVEKTLAEIDAEIAADKEAEVSADKETEVVLPEPSQVSAQPSAQVEEP